MTTGTTGVGAPGPGWQLEQAAADVDAVQRTLETRIGALLAVGRPGAEVGPFLRAFTDFDARFVQVQDALGDLHRQLAASPDAA